MANTPKKQALDIPVMDAMEDMLAYEATSADLEELLRVAPAEIEEVEAPISPEMALQPEARYKNEAGKLYIGKEFSPQEFADWWEGQYLGSRPYNGVGIHHTAIPDRHTFQGLRHINNIFAYYNQQLGWPWGRGPQIWLRSSRSGRVQGPRIYVGTHPAHDGIGISYRNHRWLHIEFIDRFDYYGMSSEDLELYRYVLRIVCGERNIPIRQVRRAVDGPSRPLGCSFHRLAGTDRKTCPGSQVHPDPFFAAMNRGSTTKPDLTTPSKPPRWVNCAHALESNDPEAFRVAKAVAVGLGTAGIRVGSTRHNVKAARDARAEDGVYSLIFGQYACNRVRKKFGSKVTHPSGKVWGVEETTRNELVVVARWRIASMCEVAGADRRVALRAYEQALGSESSGSTGSGRKSPIGGEARRKYQYGGRQRWGRKEIATFAQSKGAHPRFLKMIVALYNTANALRRERSAESNAILAPDVGCMQSALETGWGHYGGNAKPYNFAGIKKANATGPDKPGDFEKPATPVEGARMFVNHMAAYLHGPVIEPVHGRYEVARRARADEPPIRNLEDLVGNYATDPKYADKIERLLDELETGVEDGSGNASMNQRVKTMNNFTKAIVGTFYATWKRGQDEKGSPIYFDRNPGAAAVRKGGTICSGLIVLWMHVIDTDLSVLDLPGILPGGTLSMWEAWGDIEKYVPGRVYPAHTLFLTPYEGDIDRSGVIEVDEQGHVAKSREKSANPLLDQALPAYGVTRDLRLNQTFRPRAVVRPEVWMKKK